LISCWGLIGYIGKADGRADGNDNGRCFLGNGFYLFLTVISMTFILLLLFLLFYSVRIFVMRPFEM
jgi:hypothetical protein